MTPTAPARFDVVALSLTVSVALGVAALIAAPGMHALRIPAVASVALAAALLLSPNAFLVTSFLFFAVLQLTASHAFSVGAASVYPSDLFLVLVTIRAFAPRERITMPRRLHALTLGAFGIWAFLMVLGMARSLGNGTTLDTAVRSGLSVFYWPILYVGFSRVLREREIDYQRLFRAIVAASLGLIVYMFLMRALNRPFESTSPTIGHLGQVQTSAGQVFHRDFGFSSAFIVYPIISLVAFAKLVYGRQRNRAWLAIAFVSIVATLTTLIRSEIYGLIAGIAVVLLFSKGVVGNRRSGPGSRRLEAVLMLGGILFACVALVAVVSPGFAQALGERSIPYYSHESQTATENAKFRYQALTTGVSVADRHLLGLGILSPDQLQERGIDPGFLAHSGPATLLIFIGWPGLIAAALVLVGLAVDSARARSRAPGSWLHPALLGVLVMLVGNSFGAAGIVGQEFVIGIAALFIALRFAAAEADPAL